MDYHRCKAARPGDGHFLRLRRPGAAAHVAYELVSAGVEEDLRDAVAERETERDIGLTGHVGHLLDRDSGYVGEHQEPVALRPAAVDVTEVHVGHRSEERPVGK